MAVAKRMMPCNKSEVKRANLKNHEADSRTFVGIFAPIDSQTYPGSDKRFAVSGYRSICRNRENMAINNSIISSSPSLNLGNIRNLFLKQLKT